MCVSKYLIRKFISFPLCPSSGHSREEHDELRQRSQLNFQRSKYVGSGSLDFSRLVQNSLSSYLRGLVTYTIGLVEGQSEIMLKTLF